MKYLILPAILITLACMFFCYNLGYEVGKRSIITNPRGTIENLIKDMRSFTHR